MPKESIRAAAKAALLLSGAALLVLFASCPKRGESIQLETYPSNASSGQPTTAGTTVPETWPVHLVGAIENPGIYLVAPGTYLYELVEQAGGLTDDAAGDAVNLAYLIEDSRLIRIPTRDELEQQEGPRGLDGLLPDESEESEAKININTADAAALDTLPGVGPATAQAILDYRKESGPFEKIEDIKNVPGIKESRFVQIRDHITVD